jgi:hypothetical protein
MQTSTLFINRANRSFEQSTLFVIPFLFVCFAPFSIAQAVNPPPDGGYLNGNTAVEKSALFALTSGGTNTVVTTERFNTAIGAAALRANTSNENTVI